MKEKAIWKAVKGYKQALRNDPTDEETRYNLALAQEMLKKNSRRGPKKIGSRREKKDDKKDETRGEKNKKAII